MFEPKVSLQSIPFLPDKECYSFYLFVVLMLYQIAWFFQCLKVFYWQKTVLYLLWMGLLWDYGFFMWKLKWVGVMLFYVPVKFNRNTVSTGDTLPLCNKLHSESTSKWQLCHFLWPLFTMGLVLTDFVTVLIGLDALLNFSVNSNKAMNTRCQTISQPTVSSIKTTAFLS